MYVLRLQKMRKKEKNQKSLSFFMELLKDADILIWAERIQAQLTHQNPDTLQLRQCKIYNWQK